MEEKDKIITLLRQQLRKVLQENSAQKQEIALLNYELEKAKIKPIKYNFTIGIGNTTFIKFIVKYSTLIAVFGTTEIKLENKTAYETAKQMIDNKVSEYLKNKSKTKS